VDRFPPGPPRSPPTPSQTTSNSSVFLPLWARNPPDHAPPARKFFKSTQVFPRQRLPWALGVRIGGPRWLRLVPSPVAPQPASSLTCPPLTICHQTRPGRHGMSAPGPESPSSPVFDHKNRFVPFSPPRPHRPRFCQIASDPFWPPLNLPDRSPEGNLAPHPWFSRIRRLRTEMYLGPLAFHLLFASFFFSGSGCWTWFFSPQAPSPLRIFLLWRCFGSECFVSFFFRSFCGSSLLWGPPSFESERGPGRATFWQWWCTDFMRDRPAKLFPR